MAVGVVDPLEPVDVIQRDGETLVLAHAPQQVVQLLFAGISIEHPGQLIDGSLHRQLHLCRNIQRVLDVIGSPVPVLQGIVVHIDPAGGGVLFPPDAGCPFPGFFELLDFAELTVLGHSSLDYLPAELALLVAQPKCLFHILVHIDDLVCFDISNINIGIDAVQDLSIEIGIKFLLHTTPPVLLSFKDIISCSTKNRKCVSPTFTRKDPAIFLAGSFSASLIFRKFPFSAAHGPASGACLLP